MNIIILFGGYVHILPSPLCLYLSSFEDIFQCRCRYTTWNHCKFFIFRWSFSSIDYSSESAVVHLCETRHTHSTTLRKFFVFFDRANFAMQPQLSSFLNFLSLELSFLLFFCFVFFFRKFLFVSIIIFSRVFQFNKWNSITCFILNATNKLIAFICKRMRM